MLFFFDKLSAMLFFLDKLLVNYENIFDDYVFGMGINCYVSGMGINNCYVCARNPLGF